MLQTGFSAPFLGFLRSHPSEETFFGGHCYYQGSVLFLFLQLQNPRHTHKHRAPFTMASVITDGNNATSNSEYESLHTVAWVIAGCFAVAACSVSLHLIWTHLKHFRRPVQQRKVSERGGRVLGPWPRAVA